ncbi:hypothetical protein DTY81_16900 [Escherichia coli]|nr:hypothetical protein [Escherichia coli]EGD5143105.1 hypothetical protein [Escherichia coli]EIA9096080.1 DUF1627 domain-containing protein [Escherichia coli]EIH7424983.1 DUF1627 domain-containing protein [Escherichia coli]
MLPVQDAVTQEEIRTETVADIVHSLPGGEIERYNRCRI